jgi:peptidoglycan/LPS O-acetylase OafA/YrhL
MSLPANNNNFGFLRLFFASLVIVSHSPEIIDQNRSREILTNIFGTISFGELAVDSFFLISGYLILKSFYSTSSVKSYFTKRILRIYPGFIVASLFCILIVTPLAGGLSLLLNLHLTDWLITVTKLLILDSPNVNGLLLGNEPFALNGAMWSIWLEFLCYISIPVFFILGLHKKRFYIAVTITIASLFLFLLITHKDIWLPYPLRISAFLSTRLLTAFLIGGAFYHFRDRVIWNKNLSLASFVLLIVCLNFEYAAELGYFIFGGYLLFNFALNYKNKTLNQIGTKNDISYGVYLYAWPIQMLIVQHYPSISPTMMTLATMACVAVLGYLSWIYVEQPFMKIKKRLA